jgi:hypothetical protein
MEIVVVTQPVVESRLQGPALRATQYSIDKLPVRRMANKLRKKRAHKRTLRRSNTNG